MVKNPEVSRETYLEASNLLCYLRSSALYVVYYGVAEERIDGVHT